MRVIAMMDGNGDHMMSGWVNGWMTLWAVLALALVVLAVVATIWLLKHLNGSGTGEEHGKVLERRYAAGDIDRDEFLQRREDLARRS